MNSSSPRVDSQATRGNCGPVFTHVRGGRAALSSIRRAYRKAIRAGKHTEAKRLRWVARKVAA
jgi:hypothetical protein